MIMARLLLVYECPELGGLVTPRYQKSSSSFNATTTFIASIVLGSR